MSHLNPVTGHSVVDDPGAAHGSAYYQHAQPVSPIYPPDHHHHHTPHSQPLNMNMNTGGGYRGLDQGHTSPSLPPTAIGIAHSPGCGPAPLSNIYHDSQQEQQTSGQIYVPPRYNTQSPSTIGIATPAPPGAGDAYGYTHPNGSSRSFTRSPVQHIRGTPSPRPQLSPVNTYSPEHSGLPYPTSRSYSPAQQQRTYTPYSPSTSTPPPPLWNGQGSGADKPHEAEQSASQPPRAPSLLMAGRKPVENSWRDV